MVTAPAETAAKLLQILPFRAGEVIAHDLQQVDDRDAEAPT
jgi:hypothetical protein